MKKTLSIVLSLVLLVGMIPAFADVNEAGQTLKNYGIIKGYPSGDLKENETLMREHAAIILCRMMGVEEQAKSADPTELKFKDMETKLHTENARIIAYTVKKGWFKGMSTTEFGWGQTITAQQFATVLLRALGYEPDFETAMTRAQDMGLFKGTQSLGATDAILRSDVFTAMVNTLNKPQKGGSKPLKDVLGLKEEKPADETGDFAVKSVVADGLKVIRVEFNKELNEDDITKDVSGDKISVITVKCGSDNAIAKIGSSDNDNVVLAADKKTVLVVVKDEFAKQSKKLKIVVDDMKDKDGNKAEKVEKEITLLDMQKPEILKVEVKNPKTLKVMASEPMDYGDKGTNLSYWKQITIDGKRFYGKIEKSYCDGFELKAYKAIAAGEHTIKFTAIEDYAGFPIDTYEQTINIVADNEAPVLEEMTAIDRKTIKAVFNEELDKFGTWEIAGHVIEETKLDEDNKKAVIIKLNTTDPNKELGVNAIFGIEVKYKGQTDAMGNKIKDEQKFTFTVPNDADLPTVEITDVKKNKAKDAIILELKFSKSMVTDGDYTWKILDKDGKQFTVKDDDDDVDVDGDKTEFKNWKKDNTVVELTVKELMNQDASKYFLVIKDMKDGTVRANELADTKIEFDVEDTKNPTVVGVNEEDTPTYYIKDNTAIFKFSEKMNKELLMKKSNIRFNTVVDTDKQLVSDFGDDATLEYTDENELKIKFKDISKIGSASIKFIGMEDLVGNPLSAEAVPPVTPIGAKIAEKDSTKQVFLKKNDGEYYLEFNFDQPVKVSNDNAITYNSNSLNQIWVEDEKEYTKKLTFAVPENTVDEGKTALGFAYDILFGAVAGEEAIVNQWDAPNQAITVDKATIIDKVVPTIKKDPEFNDERTKITIKYSEPVNKDTANVTITRDGSVLAKATSDAIVYAKNDDNEDLENVLVITLSEAVKNKDKDVKINISVSDKATAPNTTPYEVKVVKWAK